MNDESDTHYRVVRKFWLEPTSEPKGIASAAVRSCCECGKILSAHGGGGEYLCGDCAEQGLWKYWDRKQEQSNG